MIPDMLNKILFVENKDAAEFFLKEIYKYEVGYLIVSADGSYPVDASIKNEVWGLINKGHIKTCLVVGTSHLDKVNHLLHCYVIDDFLNGDPEHDAKIIWKFFCLQGIAPNQKLIKDTGNKNLKKMGVSLWK